MCTVRSPRSGWIACLSALALGAACGHTSTTSRIQRLGEQEAKLRESIGTLETRQQALRVEVERAQRDAEQARCQASVEGYRAVVAATFAEYSVKVAEHKGCKAQAAKGAGVVAVAGCGLATFLTGGLALAVCGGALVGGAMMSESCDSAPPTMTAEDIRLAAERQTGLSREPTCAGAAYSLVGTGRHSLPSPYGGSFGGVAPSQTTMPVRHSAAKQPSSNDRRALRKAEKQRRKFEKRQKRRDKKVDASLDW